MFFDEVKTANTDLFNKTKSYIQLRSSLLKYSVYESVSRVVANATAIIISVMLGLIMLVFLSLTAAVLLKEVFGTYWPGLLIVSGFYMLLIAIVLGFRNQLFLNPLVRKISEAEHDDDDNEGVARVKFRNVNDLHNYRLSLRNQIRITEHELQSGFRQVVQMFSYQNLKKQLTSYLLELSENMLVKLVRTAIEFLIARFSRNKTDNSGSGAAQNAAADPEE